MYWVYYRSMSGADGYHRVNVTAQARAIEQHSYVVVTATTGSEISLTGKASALAPFAGEFQGLLGERELNDSGLLVHTLNLENLHRSKLGTGLFSGREINNTPDKSIIEVSKL
jgi:predicted amidohydrolase